MCDEALTQVVEVLSSVASVERFALAPSSGIQATLNPYGCCPIPHAIPLPWWPFGVHTM